MGIDFINEPGAWMDEWMKQVNENSDYHDTGAGWGVDFNGNYIFEVVPDGDIDNPVYNYAEVRDGEVHAVEHLPEADTAEEAKELSPETIGFVYSGSYDSWKRLIHGEVGPIDGLMSGDFDLDGDMQIVLKYSNGAASLASAANKVDTEFPV